MSSSSFTEQAAIDRFVRPALFRYRRVPAWEAFHQHRGEEWRIDCAMENFLAEYRASLGVVDEGETDTQDDRRARLLLGTSSALKQALWQMERDPRLWSSPEEFEVSGGRMMYPSPPPMDEEWFKTLGELSSYCSVVGASCNLRDWAVASEAARVSCTRGSQKTPSILWRQDTDAPDLGTVAPLLYRLFGGRVTRVGLKTWGDFPESMGPKLALQLTGMRVVILEGTDFIKGFPYAALMRWATQERAEWRGWDGGRYWLPMPPAFVVAGRPLPVVERVETELQPYLLPIGRGGKH